MKEKIMEVSTEAWEAMQGNFKFLGSNMNGTLRYERTSTKELLDVFYNNAPNAANGVLVEIHRADMTERSLCRR